MVLERSSSLSLEALSNSFLDIAIDIYRPASSLLLAWALINTIMKYDVYATQEGRIYAPKYQLI